VSTGLMTPYDRNSVMHYKFASCGINGNYSNAGFSEWDRLGLHILYPEAGQVAEFVGTTVIRSTDNLSLRSAWSARGAMPSVAAYSWTGMGTVPTFSANLVVNRPNAGSYTLRLSYTDFLSRSHTTTISVRVLTPDRFIRQIAAVPSSALSPLL